MAIAEHSIYQGNEYVKVDAVNYETPFDTIKANDDGTVTIHYKGEQNIIPYQELNQQSFSFVLSDQKYTAQAISTQSSKNKIFVQSDILMINSENGFASVSKIIKYTNIDFVNTPISRG